MNKKISYIETQANTLLVENLKSLKIYDYLQDNNITEVMINTDNKIFIKEMGKKNYQVGIADPQKTIQIINTLAKLRGQVINESNPTISTVLPLTNSRFEGLVPLAVENPCFTIRKRIWRSLTLDDYIKQGIITKEIKILLTNYIKQKKNLLIIGGTDTGKTTFANALLELMKDERLLLIEEVSELQPVLNDVSFFNVGEGAMEPKQALRSAMRWSPQRIIYGEVRGAEAFDLINAFNSGHSGGLCTIHANDCYGGLSKLETYILYNQPFPLSALIARTINVLITMVIVNGERTLDSIAEVIGYENGKYILDFKYQKKYEDDEVISQL